MTLLQKRCKKRLFCFLYQHFKRSILCFILSIILFWFVPWSGAQNPNEIISVQLTDHERKWLSQHRTIKIAPDPFFPPIDWIDDKGHYGGISADFIQIVKKKTGINFKVIKCKNWDEVLEKAKSREVDAIPAAAQTPERSKYLTFSEPHIILPGVIITRTKVSGDITLEDLSTMKVSVVKAYLWQEFLENDFPTMKLDLVNDLQEGLRKVALGISDALVATLPVALYYIEKEGITNLRVAGETGYYTRLSFASRKDWPELNVIVKKALDQISPSRKEEILGKWIHLEEKSLFKQKEFWLTILVIVGGCGLIVVGIALWNRSLRRRVDQRTGELKKELIQRVQAEEALRESEEKYRLLIENQTDLIVKVDSDGRFEFVSPSYCEMFNKTEEELIGQRFMPLVHKDDQQNTEKAMEALYQPPYTAYMEQRAATKDGWKWLAWVDTAMLDENENVVSIIGVGRDINNRKQIEEALQESEDKFRTFFNLSPQCIAITEADTGKLVNVNDMFCELTQYPRDEIIGKSTIEIGLYSVNDRDRLINEVYRSGESRGLKMDFKTKDGSILNTLMFAKLLRVKEEKFIFTIFVDITRQQKLEAQLQQAEKMESIGTLAGGIAHDFNNILFPMFGYLEMMLGDVPQDSPLHESLEKVFNGAKRARDLAKQILTFSRQKDHEMKPLKVHLVIKEALHLVESFLPSTIEISQSIKTDCGPVMADPTRIHQIVMNLCTNAFHAMEDTGGKLTINLKEVELVSKDIKDPAITPGPHICLTVADTGPGMAQSTIGRIFDPYFTTKKEGKGTGLGLSVVHGIVKSHGGQISVVSEPGKGSEFHVYLPLIKPGREAAKGETDTPVQKGDERILLIDDQGTIIQMEKKMLERLGYHVVPYTSSVDALEAFKKNSQRYDLVITDMTMPKMTGEQLAEEISKIRADIPVILCTGFSKMMSEEKAESLGIKGFLMKPVVMKDLSNMIRRVLDE
ncbi:MAG: PAS domain S-box protein [Thermodesulfobacteriota bacterium]|nr:PAS domain S-box protein [Thermodesulfobacteriota bacterium]